MTIIPVAEWAPDLPDLATATSVALNVLPITPESYGPLATLMPYSLSAMDGQCIGGISAQANDLSITLFAGTEDNLYSMTAVSPTWDNVSGDTYSTAQGDNWEFALFQNTVIATNFGDVMQSFALGSSTTFGPLFTAPAWTQNTVYPTTGAYVLANGNRYVLTQAGTSATSGTGPTGTGSGIVDGAADAPAWTNGTAYPYVGTQVSANGNIYALVTAGTSSLTGTGPSGTGDGIVDGATGTAWQAATAYAVLGTQIEANNNIYFLTRVGTSATTGTGPSGIGNDISDGVAAGIWTQNTVYPISGTLISANGNVYTLAQVGTSAVSGTGPSGTGTAIVDGVAIGAWGNNTAYSLLGTLVSNGGKVYELIKAGTSASSGSGPSGTSGSIVDGTCTWDYAASSWLASTAYGVLGAQVYANGNLYVLTQIGTSAGSGGPSGVGTNIVDNTCLWDYVAGQECEWNYLAPQAALWNYLQGAAAVWNYFGAQAAVWNYQAGPPPQARRICTPKNFVMVGNTYDPVGGLGPKRIWWSAAGDGTTWPAPGSDAAIQGMSDYNDFQGNLGEINGVVDSLANADVAIFFRHGVWRGIFVGPPDVFDFFPTENVRGCPAPNSIVALGAVVWYLGEDGFYSFDGATSTPIGNDKFDIWFWANVNRSYLWMVIGAVSVPHKIIIWAFPSIASSTGICDTTLIYRWDIGRASYAYLGPGALEWLFRVLSFGATLDSLSALGFNDLDTLPASLDSAIWIGGALQIAAVNGAHELAFFTGPNMAAQVATQTKQLTPGRQSWVSSARPLMDLTAGAPTVAVAGRVALYDAIVYNPPVLPDISGECPQRSDARYHNFSLAVDYGASWTHIVGAEVTATPSGLRGRVTSPQVGIWGQSAWGDGTVWG